MDSQMSFAQAEFAQKKKRTRREQFLEKMEKVIPWQRLVGRIAPHYPKGERGRPPIGIERMLRIYILQQWYGLTDELLENTIYDNQAMKVFVGIDLSVEAVPDATTLLKFRRLLETHNLTRGILEEVNGYLAERRLLLKEGTIVAAPSSTKNGNNLRPLRLLLLVCSVSTQPFVVHVEPYAPRFLQSMKWAKLLFAVNPLHLIRLSNRSYLEVCTAEIS